MSVDATLTLSARELLTKEWDEWMHHSHPRTPQSPAADDEPHEDCPMAGALPHLLEMMDEAHDQPVQSMTAQIRRLLEPNFLVDNGDSVIAPSPYEIEEEVNVVVHVLEEIRQEALRKGKWSDAPVTPIMFG